MTVTDGMSRLQELSALGSALWPYLLVLTLFVTWHEAKVQRRRR